MSGPDLGQARGRALGGLDVPVELRRDQARLLERRAAADRHGPAARLDLDHVAGLSHGDPQPSALADREPLDPVMPAEARPAFIHDLARRLQSGPPRPDEAQVVVVGDEADLLAVRLVVDREVEPSGDRPDLGLRRAAHREQDVGQEIAAQAEEDIRLVLDRVDPSGHPSVSIGPSDHPGIVAGRHEVGPDLLAVRPELAELEPDVAEDAGVGGPAGRVFVGELLHDPGEVALEIEGVERDVEPIGDRPGVDGVGRRAAGLGLPLRVVAVGSRAHEEADDLVALLLEQVRGHRTVHPAAHRQHDPAAHRSPAFTFVDRRSRPSQDRRGEGESARLVAHPVVFAEAKGASFTARG